MALVLDTEDVSAEERNDYYRDALSRLLVPIEPVFEQTRWFSARNTLAHVGPMTLELVRQRTAGVLTHVRSRALIRRSDPEVHRLIIDLSGSTVASQGGQDITLAPGDLAFYDTSRPWWLRRASGDHRFVAVTFHRELVPVSPARIRAVCGACIDGREPIAGLISPFLVRLAHDAGRYDPVDAMRLATTTADLLAILVRQRLGATELTVPAASHRRVLLMQAQGYIGRCLGDPTLCPATVAASLHVSLRTLHKAFQEHDLTVAGWIRACRLERCRHDLLDPALSYRPVRSIAERYGFTAASHFSRAFRAAYGHSPQDYRRRHAEALGHA
jgi:AraC-like DNA-binding protein